MLTLVMKVTDVYLEIKYSILEALLEIALEQAKECSRQRDVEGMKRLNEVCRGLALAKEKTFKKRLFIRGY
jgi:hypothetical protein